MKGRRAKGRSVPSVTISERKEGKRKEPVTSVTILMQPMAVAYMKLDNHAGSKGHPLLIYRTSCAYPHFMGVPHWLRLIPIPTFGFALS